MQDIFKRFEHFSKIFQEQLAKFPAAESPILIQNGALKRKHDGGLKSNNFHFSFYKLIFETYCTSVNCFSLDK